MKHDFINTVLVSRYKLIEEIGSGGMAFVYKAMDIRLNRYVAVKILKTEFTDNKDFVQRFSYEAMSAASITHPNIVSIYDAGYDKNLFFIVMELIEGITLKDLIDKKKCLKWKDALSITKQILSAMEVAHKNNIIHRDIKPHNIMLTYDGAAKVADFGIARVVSGNTRDMSDLNIGSVHYISPEQAKGKPLDERADLYSIGITLFEMLIGNVPFDGETAVVVAMKNIKEPLKPPHLINPAVPVGVSDFVVRATMKNPDERYQSASAMMSSLQVVLLLPDEHLNYSTEDHTLRDKELLPRNSGRNEIRPVRPMKPPVKEKASFSDLLKNNSPMIIILAISLVLAITVFSISLGSVSGSITDFCTVEYEVVDFTGKDYEKIAPELSKLGINIAIMPEKSENIEKGKIMSQIPDAGNYIKPGNKDEKNTITFVVSYGTKDFPLMDYSYTTNGENVDAKDYRFVKRALESLGIIVEFIDVYSSNVPYEHVICTRPSVGENVNSGDIVYVYRSLGNSSGGIHVGNYVGMTKSQAESSINSAKLKPEIKEIIPEINGDEENTTSSPTGSPLHDISSASPTSKPKPSGNVIAQYPPSGSVVKEGESVVLYFSAPENFRTERQICMENNDNMNLSESFELKIIITPSDTGKKQYFGNEGRWIDSESTITFQRVNMPFVFDAYVPYTGESVIEIYINNEHYCKYILKSDD